jgi:hypothetical protein
LRLSNAAAPRVMENRNWMKIYTHPCALEINEVGAFELMKEIASSSSLTLS